MSLKKPNVYCVGVSHRTAPVSFREYLYIDSKTLEPLLMQIAQQFNFDEILVISTCNRFELHVVSRRHDLEDSLLLKAYMRLQSLANKETQENSLFQQYTYSYKELNAIEHIFAVVASLDSLVIGETQITGQFKDAMKLSLKAGCLGPFIDRLGQEALNCAKKVRSQTKIGEKKVSISHAAIDLAKRVFRNLDEHSILMIGAGEMAQVAAFYVCKYNPQELVILNRSMKNAEVLVDKLGCGRPADFSRIEQELINADIVISSTAASAPVISYDLLKRVMHLRSGRSLFLVDIAIPRDIEPRCSELDDVYLFEIDDLQKVVDGNLEARRKAAQEGREIVEKKAEYYLNWLRAFSLKPIFSNFRDYLDDLTNRELERTLGKIIFQNLSEQQICGIKSMLQSVAGKIVGDVAQAVNEHDDFMYREQLAMNLSMMFTKKLGATATDSLKKFSKEIQDEDVECDKKIIQL